ncbi:MAG TPA: hypothetical protein VGW58_04130 [Pyrinomonadaceae bacterium]|nr:hypothetical protein [Pyrinomonadaceae bacterium]
MSKHVSSVLAAAILTLALAALAVAQTTTTTTTQKTVVQNPDGTYTVIEYPVKKEIKLDLTPVTIQGATGVATILRDDDGTKIKLNLTNVPADVSALTLYAVDDAGMVTALGPITISNGVGEFAATTPLSKFMLIASPETALTAYDANTKIFFRSAVPQGLAVIPVKANPSGEKVSAVTTPTGTQVAAGATYTAPLLNIPAFKKGDDTKIKVDFSGPLSGARANVFITPRKDGPTEVKMRFHDLKEAPAGQHFIVWAVGADGTYQKVGEIVNTGGRNEAEIKTETTLADFGLLITQESAIGVSPVGPAVATIHIVP